MCCLGFDAINEGFTETEIENVYEPCYLENKIEGITIKANNDNYFINTQVSWDLMRANDDESCFEEEREEKITKLFAKIGRKVEFIN